MDYTLKVLYGRVNALLTTGKDVVKTNISVTAARQIVEKGKILKSDIPGYPIHTDTGWYFEGVEVKKTAKKAQLSSMYGKMKEAN